MGDKVAGREAKVLFDYQKVEVDELTLQVGDIIKNVIVVPDVDGWCEGETDGNRGMFPSNFVEFLPSTTPVEPPSQLNQLLITADCSSPDVAGCKAIVRFVYDATAEDELTLKVDDVVDVIAEVEPGWWQGSLNGKTGVFPDNFCELLPEEKPSGNIAAVQDKTEKTPAALPLEPVPPPVIDEPPQDTQNHTTGPEMKVDGKDCVDAVMEQQEEGEKRRSKFGGVGFGNIISQDILSGARLRKVEKKLPAAPAPAPPVQEKISLKHVSQMQVR